MTNMSHPHKQQLLEEFAEFLDQTGFDESDLGRQPDLNSLLTEMAGLKAEVKAESRHLKSMLDQFSESLETLRRSNESLTEELNRSEQRLAENQRDIRREMILEFLDVYDRLTAGAAVLKQYKPVDRLFSHSKKQDRRFIKSIRDGQDMSIKRLEQLLQSHQVHTIETEGKPFDPNTMTAVSAIHQQKLPHAQVVEEIRKGFYFENSVLRLAEVKVNKNP